MNDIAAAIVGALVTAAVSTSATICGRTCCRTIEPMYWLAHGALLFLTVGLSRAGRQKTAGRRGGRRADWCSPPSRLLPAPSGHWLFGLFVMFVALWLALGLLNGRVLQPRDTMRVVLVRSALAAVGSGLGFYAISGIWFPFDPQGWDYAVHFVCWTIAYLPGFAALLVTWRTRKAHSLAHER